MTLFVGAVLWMRDWSGEGAGHAIVCLFVVCVFVSDDTMGVEEREGEILIGAGELGRDGKVQRMVQVGRWLSGGDHPRAHVTWGLREGHGIGHLVCKQQVRLYRHPHRLLVACLGRPLLGWRR